MQLPHVGADFEGKYKLVAILGRGGFAQVYRAIDIDVGRDVAIKILLPGPDGYQPETVRRFMREARVIARLHHANTITMFEFGRTSEDLLFMVFEFVEGQDLADTLEASGPLPASVATHVLQQVLSALVEAHEHRVLHRDIKPANILIFGYMDDRYRVKLIDFGIAKPLAARTGEPTVLTREGMVVGTPRYMAPEQFFGEELTPASDVYSLGLVACEMLTGQPAISSKEPALVVRQQISDAPLRVPMEVGTPALRAVIERMMARAPRDRFATAGEALRALHAMSEHAARGQREMAPRTAPSASTTAPEVTAAKPEVRSNRALAWMAIGVLFVLAVAGVLGVALPKHPDSAVQKTPRLPPALTRTPPSAGSAAEVPPRASTPDVGHISTGRSVDASLADGCGKPWPLTSGRVVSVAARVGMMKRTWAVYVPRGYDSTVRHPVVLMFHRSSRVGRDIIATTRFGELADEHRFIIVAPDSSDSRSPWNDPADIDAVDLAVAESRRDLCIDHTRVYAVGDGAGGRFAANLPCRVPISAVALHAYGQYHDEQICTESIAPTLRVYGAQDRDVPVDGGPGCMGGRSFITAEETTNRWLTRNECSGSPKTWLNQRNGRCRTWNCRVGFVSCELDGGHDWPGSAPPMFEMPACSAPIVEFPLGEAIWRFFAEEGRRVSVQ